MPMAIPLIIAGVSAASGVASTIHGLTGGGGGGGATPAESPDQVAQKAIAQEQQNRQIAARAMTQQLPGLQSDTSGSLNPLAMQDMSAVLSGNAQYANNPNMMTEVVNRFLGMNNGAGTPPMPGPPGQVGSTGLTGSSMPGNPMEMATNGWLQNMFSGSGNPFSSFGGGGFAPAFG